MRSENIWGKWYIPPVRVICHVVFWALVCTIYYLTFLRLGGSYIWAFVIKELIVTTSLFYSATWLISKWVAKGQVIPILLFFIFSYCWWLAFTYITCDLLKNTVPSTDERIYRYVNYFLKDGFLGIYNPDKAPVLILDFLFLVSLPLTPKLVKSIVEHANIVLVMERNKTRLELEKSILERDNLKLELEILKSQVAPHFLFNTLNSIYRLAEKDSPKTAESIMQLSNMLGYTLYQTDDDKIYLSKEIQFLRAYLNLITTKFEQYVKLDFQIDEINDPYWIVPLMLLPFIENAIKHGPERSRINAWIKISLGLNDGILNFVVANGVNRDSKEPPKGGIGLQNVKRRLELKYSNKYSLDIKEEPDSYTVFLKIDMNN
ncbi:MAG: histidine kinase [Sphingobacterium sp.]|jgi:sensor histidine kinase YesM|uniref:sensor histidine kinase n=1 Tax=Sphingobacterium sp. TaxID=341027 RepID=UPI00283D4927|nr:histidine kinase [Sphingobacterium sp.]MDR3010600.1 histidine kinase [Sphingobacterium sp.]